MNLFVILNELKSTGKKPWADPGSNSGLMTFKVHSHFCRTFYMNYSFDISESGSKYFILPTCSINFFIILMLSL